MDSLRIHWRTIHQWTRFGRRGRVSQQERTRREAELQQSFIYVSYQRLFSSGTGSHYIHIRFPNDRHTPPSPPDQAQQAVDTVIQAWEATELAQNTRLIQPESVTDANPWLRVTQWAVYIRDIPTDDLLSSIAPPDTEEHLSGESFRPEPNPDHQLLFNNELAIQLLRETIDQLARKSQRTVQHCGSAIRMEAVRTQIKELPYHPLQAYMDEESIQRHVHSWQQILTFFARTQSPHEWKSAPYDFTPRQRLKWRCLWQAVCADYDPIDEAADPDLQPWLMSWREQACLEFCVELLNQRQRSTEYESALVCAMAVLGRGEDGWRTSAWSSGS
ncbi:hypothetical protein FE257_003855 [Aspergillus nanangensis]|uniref:Uncharacterized protein n=1 Tax=Aspergillus nanangensis TaxID=2582783 RepID=A0AAD4GPD3_ASPNN|nr:hypothetical protein FE257_003855 [Aspergillus nanangensis]